MTKHNLGDHLAWLLNRGPSLYPSLGLLENTSNGNPTPDRRPLVQSPSAPEISTAAIPSSNSAAPVTRPNAVPTEDPSLDQSDIIKRDGSTVTSDINMARLQFAPQSTSKPRMLSRVNGTPTPKTPTASTPRVSQEPQTRTRSWGQSKDNLDFAPASPTDWPPRKTPSHREASHFKFQSPFADVDSIDLTGDLDDQDSSSATVEAFGEARPIWREDSASRAEPLEKRGKKRKSDEYKSDLRSPRKSGPRVNTFRSHLETNDLDDFVAIDDFDEDLELQEAPAADTSSRGDNVAKKPQELEQGRTILDSEDEDIYEEDGIEFHDAMTDTLTCMEIDAELYPKLPGREVAGKRENPFRPTSSGDDSKDEAGNTPKAASSASPFQQDSPTKDATKPQQRKGLRVGNGCQQPSPEESTITAASQSFPISPATLDRLEKLSVEYEKDVKRNAEIAYERAIQGLSAPSLAEQNNVLNSKILAIQQLRSEREAYDLCLLKRDELKKNIIQRLAKGDYAATDSVEMNESRKLTEELQKREVTARGLLQRVGTFDSDNVDAAIQTPPQHTLVAGTQMPAFGSEPVKKCFNSATQDDSILPTHPPKPGPSTVPREGTVDLLFDEGPKSADGNRPPLKKGLNHGTQSNYSSSRRLETDFGSVSGTVQNAMTEEDEFMWDEDEDIFSRNMGSPTVTGFDIGDFEHDADDGDLLEAAEMFENRRSLDTEGYLSHDRQIFSETSGNVSRTPLANKTSNPRPEPLATTPWHPWSKDVKAALTGRFHLRGFRHNQLEAINATLSGKDAFVLMPTGGGKSLCYQLPSVISSGRTRGITIVISPLLSLMQDQVAHLKKLHIRATLINGEVPSAERKEILNSFQDPRAEEKIQLLYVTPEMVNMSGHMKSALRKLHGNGKLARIVIDEAHCVSQWGHDFRPDYKMLGEVRRDFPGVPVMALTATATENVKIDIIHNLGISNCEVFTQSFNRPNLTYEVLRKARGTNITRSIAEKIKTKYKRQSGIVYCLSRQACETTAKKLRDAHGISAAHYHAGMEPKERASVQKDWQSGIYHVIVATIAFGMGIDKPDVRFVIHYSIPKSLEGYYQETGRAGRDGKPSGCYLYYGFQDTSSLRQMINKGEGSLEQKQRQHQMLRNVVQYCENMADCRRVQVLAYFNERFQRESCKLSCDNCKSPDQFENRDFTEQAILAIKLVQSLIRENKRKKEEDDRREDDLFTLVNCVDLFRGKNIRQFADHELARIEGYGAGSDLDRGILERIFQRLLIEDAFAEINSINGRGFALNYLTTGYRAGEFASGRRQVKILVLISPKNPRTGPKKNRGAEAGGAGDEHPESTNVSSPVQSMSRTRLQRNQARSIGIVESDEDEDSYGFEPIREGGKSVQSRRPGLGPPITNDEKLDSLDLVQRIVLDFFLEKAKKECSEIMLAKGLRNQPFPDSILRDMGILFPKDKQQLLMITNIDPDKVNRYGSKFLKLIREAETKYEEMSGRRSSGGPTMSSRRVSNTISISSEEDNDDDMGDFIHDQELNELAGDERSAYFEPEMPPPPGFSAQQPMRNSGSQGNRGASKGGQRGKRAWKGKGTGGGSKRKGARSSNGSGTSGRGRSSGSKRGGASRSSTSRGIGMMPT